MHSDGEAHIHKTTSLGGNQTVGLDTGTGIKLPIRILYPSKLTKAASDQLYAAVVRNPVEYPYNSNAFPPPDQIRYGYTPEIHEALVRDLEIKSAYFSSEYYRWLKDNIKDRSIYLQPYVLTVDEKGIPKPENLGGQTTAIDVYFDISPCVARLEQVKWWYGIYQPLDFGMETTARVMVMKGGASLESPRLDDFLQVAFYPYDAAPFLGWNIFTTFTRKSLPSIDEFWNDRSETFPSYYSVDSSVDGKITLIRRCLSERYAHNFGGNKWFDPSYVKNPAGDNIPFIRLWRNYGSYLQDALERNDVQQHEKSTYAAFVSSYDPSLAQSLSGVSVPNQAQKLKFIEAVRGFEAEYARKLSDKIMSQVYLSEAGVAFRQMIQNEEYLRRQTIIAQNSQEMSGLFALAGAVSSMSAMRTGASPMIQTMNSAIQTMVKQNQVIAETMKQQSLVSGDDGETFKVTSDNLITVYLNVASGALEVTGKNLDDLRAKFHELYKRQFGN